MQYYSTHMKSDLVSFREAIFQGLAPDGGLYMPLLIPSQSVRLFTKELPYSKLAAQLIAPFVEDEIPENILNEICESAFSFPVPVVKLDHKKFVLELFHGPTLAFKDFAARFMARSMAFFMENESKERTILVATSGDTGSAVANGFYRIEGIKIVILYPSGRVSHIQEKQLTTLGKNITALEVDGTFDDCQEMVKAAFLDEEIRSLKQLGSANSINIARLLPQAVYYVWAWIQSGKPENCVFSVPSGNFGNLTGGLIAKRMGLPVKKFIAAVNSNDVFPQYLNSGNFNPMPGKRTLSNAMDVGNPSNLDRINALYAQDVKSIRDDIDSYSFDDDNTRETILQTLEQYNYLSDPHTAVGISGFNNFKEVHGSNNYGIILATAHPGKFSDILEPVINKQIGLPSQLKNCLVKEKNSIKISNDYIELKNYLIDTK